MPRSVVQQATPAPPERRVVFLVCPQLVLLDLVGPLDTFHVANGLSQPGEVRYVLEVVTPGPGLQLTAHSGLTIVAHRSASAVRGAVDTLMVPASFSDGQPGESLLRPLRRLAARTRRVASVCGGAFYLAAAGLLDGRRATTHWNACEELAQRYPRVRVEPDALFIKDGKIYTSAGVTAGIDLALALIEEDHGRARALQVARQLVMFIRRPGGQTQFSASLAAQMAEREPLQDLLAWAADHPGSDLSVEALAARAHMSPRNFARVFQRELGKTPARYVERLRIDAARQKLEETGADLERVAVLCGFGSADSMRRSFMRVLKVAPSDYRDRFRRRPAAR